MKKKKIGYIFVSMLLMLSQLSIVSASGIVIKPALNNKIPANYGTSFKMTQNYDISYSEHFKDNDLGNSSIPSTTFEKYVPHDQLTSSQFGKIWWQYNNIASYEGKSINIKFTALSWDTTWKYPNGADIAPTGGRYYLAVHSTGAIGAFSPFNTRLKVEFIDDNGNHVHIKGYLTAVDMDGKVSESSPEETMILHNGIDYAYIGSNIEINGDTIFSTASGATETSDKTVQATICFNGSSFEYTYVNGAFTGFTNTALTEFEVPEPVKKVSKEQAVKGETIDYVIQQFVPRESDEYYYKSFEISDNIPDVLTWNVEDVKLIDEFDNDVSSYFYVSRNEDVLLVKAKDENISHEDFYCKTYNIIIPATINADDLSSMTTSEGTLINNQAVLTTNRGSQTSNEVKTEIKYNIATKITNGSITSSLNDIKGGSNQIISFKADDGYYISSIKVDGVEKNINDTDKGQFEFTNILDNHVIEVVCSEKYHIDTEITNGTISDPIDGIKPNENKTIEYKANDGYYISSIKVDGNVLSLEDYPKSYTFSNINENHSIQVICQPIKIDSVIKQNEDDNKNINVHNQKAKTPQTGDTTSYDTQVLTVLLLGSAVLFAGALVHNKKGKKKDEVR